MRKFVLLTLTVLTLALYLGACGDKYDRELGDAEAALKAAKEAGAEEFAAEEYRQAEELLNKAKELMAQGKYKEARELLVQARYKAIEAKGKALIAKSQMEMTEGEIIAKEQELEQMKGDKLPGSNFGLVDVFFDYDSSNVNPDSIPVLKQNAGIIKANPSFKLVAVEGYCDVRGTEEYNLALGQKRADSIRAYLVGLGVSPSVVQSVSKGETEQWSPGATESAYQQNRRAHFVVVSSSSPRASADN
ncbi:MAG: OmpA family protein [Deltaproteobacteria bacterium]